MGNRNQNKRSLERFNEWLQTIGYSNLNRPKGSVFYRHLMAPIVAMGFSQTP